MDCAFCVEFERDSAREGSSVACGNITRGENKWQQRKQRKRPNTSGKQKVALSRMLVPIPIVKNALIRKLSPGKPGGLNGSTQHEIEVYFQRLNS
jgi:hypothetical protein